MGSNAFHIITQKKQQKATLKSRLLHTMLFTLCFSAPLTFAENISYHDKSAYKKHSTDAQEPTHRARVVAIYDAPKENQKTKLKDSQRGIENQPSPDTVFKAYKQAVVAGELNAYERFYSKALLTKTNKQTENYNAQQITNLKRWNQKLMLCRDDKMISKTINRNKATIIYEITDICQEHKKPSKSYQRVIFKRKLKRKSNNNAVEERGWKIDRLTLSKHNDFNANGNLKLQLGMM